MKSKWMKTYDRRIEMKIQDKLGRSSGNSGIK